jgi:hypothetical protein
MLLPSKRNISKLSNDETHVVPLRYFYRTGRTNLTQDQVLPEPNRSKRTSRMSFFFNTADKLTMDTHINKLDL